MLKQILQGLLAAFLIAGTACDAAVTAGSQNNVYTEDKLNISIDAAHPQFVLKLKSNPTTGYSWFLREYDSNLIMPVKHAFTKPDNDMPGAGGFETWTFKIKPVGFTVPQQTILRLIYARPWQGAEGSTQLVFRVSTVGK